MIRGIILVCAALLHTHVTAQAPTASKAMMQLVRCYEAAQDSVYASGISDTRSNWMHQKHTESVVHLNSINESGDTALIAAAEYMYWATAMYDAITQQRTAPDSATIANIIKLYAPARLYVPEVFPLRFTVFGNNIVLRYDDVIADLELYYSFVKMPLSCSELKQLVPHLKVLGLEELARQSQKKYRDQCRRWWEIR